MARAITADLKRRYDLQLRLIRFKIKSEADQEKYGRGSSLTGDSGAESMSAGNVSDMGSEEF